MPLDELLKCKSCGYIFTRREALTKHTKLNRCPILKLKQEQIICNLNKTIVNLTQENDNYKKIVETIKDVPPTTNININNSNNLQVMCVNSSDNFLDILTQRSNALEALTFIKDCALSRLAGDCRLLEKVYLNGPRPAIISLNQNKTRFIYYNENNQKVIETDPKVLARKLADCLQKTYLKGINFFQTDISDPDPLKTDKIESYDVEDWNEHIHELSNEKYQRKVLERLRIPFETDIYKLLVPPK